MLAATAFKNQPDGMAAIHSEEHFIAPIYSALEKIAHVAPCCKIHTC